MFDHDRRHFGSIEVICGPMFSGKTEELIRRARRAEYAKLKVEVFKPVLDNRYDVYHIVSHSSVRLESCAVASVEELRGKISSDTDVIVIDEIQFFEPDVIEFCESLADQGMRVIVAGLDLDYRSQPFDIVAQLMARAERVTKLSAICIQCGEPASKSFRLSSDSETILVGGSAVYEARCRTCFNNFFSTVES